MEPVGILFLTNSLPIGGFETHLLSIVRELDRRSLRPVIACLKGEGPLAPEFRAVGVPVHSRMQSHRLDPRGISRLTRLMKAERIRILDTDVQRNTVFLGALSARLAGVPVVVASLHATARAGKDRLLELPARMVLPWVDRVIALADFHRDLLLSQEHLSPGKIAVCWNGVDTDAFAPGPPSEALTQELGLPSGSRVVGIVASLRPDKGHEVFLSAAGRVLRRCPDTVFLVVGDGPERANLENLSRDLGIERSVRFLGRRRDLPQILRLFDINVLSSYPLVETFPISVLEAAASGKPTVATRVGALSDIVAEGQTGFLVDVGDAEAIAGAVVRLLDDRTLLEGMGKASRQRAEDLFSIRKTVDRREALYLSLLAGRRT